MKIIEVLNRVPDLDRDTLDYWERQGYIKANWTRRGERKVREYSPQQVKKIQLMNKYYQMGVAPRKASQKADREMQEETWVLDFLYYRTIPLLKAFQPAIVARVAAEDFSAFHAPILRPSDKLGKEQLLPIFERNYLRLNYDSLTYVVDKFLGLSEELLNQVDTLMSLGSSASVIAGAGTFLALERDILYPTIIPWEDRERAGLDSVTLLILAGNVKREDNLGKIARILEDDFGCEVKAIICLLIWKEDQEKISKEGYLVQSLFLKDEVTDRLINKLDSGFSQ